MKNLNYFRMLLWLLLTLPAVVQAQYYYTTNNGTITITAYAGLGGAVIIPSTINGLPVTAIGDNAFRNNTSLTIPNSVTSIGVTAFYFCTSLINVTIGNSVTGIGHHAFYYCTSLTIVTIPNNVTSIEWSAFAYCDSLTSVTIPNSVTYIGEYAFQFCTSLTSVTIPNSVTSSGDYAFEYCTSLSSVTIGSSVTNMGLGAFRNCISLTQVYFQGNAPSVGFNVFLYAGNVTVYYLPGTTGWGTTFGGRPAVLWNPLVATSDASFGVRTNRFGFTITGTADILLVVEATTNLASPAWIPVGTNTLTGGSSYFSDPQWTNHPARFYRLRSP
jgi:hypothetical protein